MSSKATTTCATGAIHCRELGVPSIIACVGLADISYVPHTSTAELSSLSASAVTVFVAASSFSIAVLQPHHHSACHCVQTDWLPIGLSLSSLHRSHSSALALQLPLKGSLLCPIALSQAAHDVTLCTLFQGSRMTVQLYKTAACGQEEGSTLVASPTSKAPQQTVTAIDHGSACHRRAHCCSHNKVRGAWQCVPA
jgi:hypothetical protein